MSIPPSQPPSASPVSSPAGPSPLPAPPYPAAASMPPLLFPPPDTAIATAGLTRVFGKKFAVNGLSLAVRRGEFFGFLGPNGAGKSTTIKMLVGLLRPTSGAAYVGGVEVWRDPLAA